MSTNPSLPDLRDVALEVTRAPLTALRLNPWNPNRMNRRTYDAARESIRTYGFIDPITVRPHPTLDGELVGEGGNDTTDEVWQVLDGEHRQRAASDEQITDVPIAVLRGLTDDAAKKLTVIFNETRGEPDPISLAVLIRELEGIQGADILVGLPYTEADLANFLEIGKVDWDNFDAARQKEIDQHLQKTTGGKTRFLTFFGDEARDYDTWVEMIAREKGYERAEEAILHALRTAATTL